MKVGVNVAIIAEGRILLTKRQDFGVWCMPGGGVDKDESIADAAFREAVEETGIEVRLSRMVGLYNMPKANGWANLIVVFVGEPIGGELTAQEGEVVDMACFPFDEIPGNLLFGHRQRIQDALDGIGGSAVWRQHIPFDDVDNRQELYQIVEDSGLSGDAFYEEHFGFDDPIEKPSGGIEKYGRTSIRAITENLF